MIKKVALNFCHIVLVVVVCYHLCPTAIDNFLTWGGAALTGSMMVYCDIDFVSIIRYELHGREFGNMTTLPFPCLVQLLYDEVSMPKIPGVDHRVDTKGVAQKILIKDPENSILA